jgi:microcin C transport system substrate-binding protein
MRQAIVAIFAVFALLCSGAALAADVYRSHGIAMHGDLKYPAGFKHFDYVNPNAPKGGDVKLGAIGGFDTFNGSIVKGRAASGLGLIYDTLMVSSSDEPFSMYGLIAESVEMARDRSWIVFHLNSKARWHDGKPISVEDVIWTFNTLIEKGTPFYRYYYGSVAKVEKTGPRSVKFSFKPGENRELPLIVGQLAVLPKHYWESRDFTVTTLDPPLGSGPYRIKSFEANRQVVYERVKDYWAAMHPVRRGEYNFDTLRFEYFRDATVSREAFKSGAFDYRSESSSKAWATEYDIPAVKNGYLIKRKFKHNRSSGMQGFAFNLRRSLFEDPQVRQALSFAFDFEWSNKTLFYGQYTRTNSYFDNSELASTGLPKGEELKLLEQYRDKLPPQVFQSAYAAPVTDGSGNIRANLRIATKMLREAGWVFDRKDRILKHAKTGQEFRFEVLLVSPLFERVVLPFKKNLERLGIDVRVRTVDSAQYQKRVQKFDYDIIVGSWGQSLSPGNEQRNYWGSDAAARIGSRNLAGLKDPVVDKLIEKLIAAPTRKDLVTNTRALDRVLLWKFLVIPHFHIPFDRVLYWNMFGIPKVIPDSGANLFTWWVDPARQKALSPHRQSGKSK